MVSGVRFQVLLTNDLGVVFAREADVESQIFDALHCTNSGRVHDRVPISREQTTHSNASGRESWAIRNEMFERNRRGAFAGVYPGRPDADRTGRIQRTIYHRRYGLRPTARLSGLLRDETRRLHAARRRDAVSVIARQWFGVSGVRFQDRLALSAA